MSAAERLGDPNSAGATITSVKQGTVFVNGVPLAVNGSSVAGHPGGGPHASPVTTSGSANVFAENIPVNKEGDPDSCGHPRTGGSSNVFIN